MKKLFYKLGGFATMALALTAYSHAAAPSVDLTVDKVYAWFIKLACYFGQFVELMAVAAIIWFGIQMTLSKGNEAAFSTAKQSLLWAIVGTLVIFATYTIIITVVNLVGGDYPLTLFSCSHLLPGA